MAGAPVERGVNGSELETESMALTDSAPRVAEVRGARAPGWLWTLSNFALVHAGLVLSAVNRTAAVMRRKTLSDSQFQTICNLVSVWQSGASDGWSWLGCQ